MTQFFACILKETRLLTRDIHAMLLLFIMPLTFILIMSLALQDAFDAQGGSKRNVLIGGSDVDHDIDPLVDILASSGVYDVRKEIGIGAGSLTDWARRGTIAFAIQVHDEFPQFIATGIGEPVSVIVAPNIDKRDEIIFINAVRDAIARQRMVQILNGIGHRPNGTIAPAISIVHAYGDEAAKRPTAVQQNVPAWLIFAVFFVATPFSTAVIRERELGTHNRMRTIAISPIAQIIGKIVPYFVVNQFQVAGMLAAGVFLVPLLGGQRLELNGDLDALVLLCASLSIAALGLSLLVAVVARSTEQATMLSGLGNIVLAAIGGIMVPAFIMPIGMQKIAEFSPMAWGLDGFLQLFLHDGGIADISLQLLKLVSMGLCSMLLAATLYRYSE